MKEYIKSRSGKVEICISNVAKMNVFEWMYYRRDDVLDIPRFSVNQFIEGIELIGAGFINLLCIPIYPIIGLFAIRKAKKEIKEYNIRCQK